MGARLAKSANLSAELIANVGDACVRVKGLGFVVLDRALPKSTVLSPYS